MGQNFSYFYNFNLQQAKAPLGLGLKLRARETFGKTDILSGQRIKKQYGFCNNFNDSKIGEVVRNFINEI